MHVAVSPRWRLQLGSSSRAPSARGVGAQNGNCPTYELRTRLRSRFWETGEAEDAQRHTRCDEEAGEGGLRQISFAVEDNGSCYWAELFLLKLQPLCRICGLPRALAKGGVTNHLM